MSENKMQVVIERAVVEKAQEAVAEAESILDQARRVTAALNEMVLLKLGDARDGDILVLKSDDIDVGLVTQIRNAIHRLSGKRLVILGIDTDADVILLKTNDQGVPSGEARASGDQPT